MAQTLYKVEMCVNIDMEQLKLPFPFEKWHASVLLFV
jgi:hypothetical protein